MGVGRFLTYRQQNLPLAAELVAPAAAAVLLAVILAMGGGASAAVAARPPRSCPPHPPASIPTNRWATAGRQLAPAGAAAIRLCRYSGLNDHPASALIRQRLVGGGRAVRGLVRQFDALRPFPPGVYAVACPADDGSQILAFLAYPSGHRVTISVGLTGCNLVTNGDVHRTAANFAYQNPAGPKLLAALERLTR